jgi:hypothetical protein
MFLRQKGGVESKWPREGVVTARITVNHGGISQMNYQSNELPVVSYYP